APQDCLLPAKPAAAATFAPVTALPRSRARECGLLRRCMANALFSYTDIPTAQRAAQRAATQLPAKAVVLHAKDRPGADSILDEVDEAFSGCFFQNLFDLWQQQFEWDASPHDASDYAETVRKGGAVVSIDASTAEERRRADESMQDTGFAQRTDWKE